MNGGSGLRPGLVAELATKVTPRVDYACPSCKCHANWLIDGLALILPFLNSPGGMDDGENGTTADSSGSDDLLDAELFDVANAARTGPFWVGNRLALT